jgi:hypothetical protein
MKLTLENAVLSDGFFTWTFPSQMKFRYEITTITTEIDLFLTSKVDMVKQMIQTNHSNDECDYTFEDDKLRIGFLKGQFSMNSFTSFIALEIEVTEV